MKLKKCVKPGIALLLASSSLFANAATFYSTKYDFTASANIPKLCVVQDTSSSRTELRFGKQNGIPSDAYTIKIVTNVQDTVNYSIDTSQTTGLQTVDGSGFDINFRSNVDMMEDINVNQRYDVDNFQNGQSEIKFWAETERGQSYFKPTNNALVSTTITISCDD